MGGGEELIVRIPGLIDLVRTADPAHIDALAADSRIDRRFRPEGPIFNRFLTSRILSTLAVDGKRLPAIDERCSTRRSSAQLAISERLAGVSFKEVHLDALAAHMRGEGDPANLALVAQEAIGQLFAADFRATRETWEAAQTIDAAPRTFNPLRLMTSALSGRVRRARRLLADAVHRDPVGMHAVALAVHSLVRSLESLREQVQGHRSADMDDPVLSCIVPPESVLRQVTSNGDTAAGKLRRGTLVQFRLREAAKVRQDLAFMAGTWSYCPAREWVLNLLAEVRARALATNRSAGG